MKNISKRVVLIRDKGKYKCGSVIWNRQRGQSIRLNTEKWVLCFIYTDCREKEGRKSRTKTKMQVFIKLSKSDT
jgi:hypothetical protein